MISSPMLRDSDGANGDVMEMFPLVSCVMSHFERELPSEHSHNWRMFVHLLPSAEILRSLHWGYIFPKIDRLDGVGVIVENRFCKN